MTTLTQHARLMELKQKVGLGLYLSPDEQAELDALEPGLPGTTGLRLTPQQAGVTDPLDALGKVGGTLTQFNPMSRATPSLPQPGVRMGLLGPVSPEGSPSEVSMSTNAPARPVAVGSDHTKRNIALAAGGSAMATVLAAIFGGKEGAAAVGGGVVEGFSTGLEGRRKAASEEKKLSLLDRKNTLDETREEETRKRTARQSAANTYALRKVVLPDLHPDDKAAVDRAEADEAQKKREAESRKAPATRNIRRGNKLVAQTWNSDTQTWENDKKGEGFLPERTPKEEKAPSAAQLRTEIKDREEEIEDLSVTRRDAQGQPLPNPNQAEIDQLQTEVDQFKSELKSQGRTMIQKLGKVRVNPDTIRTETPDPISDEEFNELKVAVANFRKAGLTDAQIREKLKAKAVDETTFKTLGL